MRKSDDGVGGEEGTFCLCTLWYVLFCFFHRTGVDSYLHFLIRCVEALTRAGEVDRRLLPKAVNMFEVRSQHLPWLADMQTLMTSCDFLGFPSLP